MKILTAPSSGSIAGTTYSHNRAGQYTRNRRSPVQPVGTGRRGVIRAAFGAASSAWGALTPIVQANWTAYANGHPYTDSLGQSIKLTGHQMYVAVNTDAHQLRGGAVGGNSRHRRRVCCGAHYLHGGARWCDYAHTWWRRWRDRFPPGCCLCSAVGWAWVLQNVLAIRSCGRQRGRCQLS